MSRPCDRNNVHQYLADGGLTGRIEPWLEAIDLVRALAPTAVVAGHKDARSDDPQILDEAAAYLLDAREILRKRPTPAEFFAEMVRRYPDRLNPGTAWLNAQRLGGWTP
jgi:hypothetical protein